MPSQASKVYDENCKSCPKMTTTRRPNPTRCASKMQALGVLIETSHKQATVANHHRNRHKARPQLSYVSVLMLALTFYAINNLPSHSLSQFTSARDGPNNADNFRFGSPPTSFGSSAADAFFSGSPTAPPDDPSDGGGGDINNNNNGRPFAPSSTSPASTVGGRSSSTGGQDSPLVWQPLPLRATFRPLNRGSTADRSGPAPPQPPAPPTPPTPPTLPEALALISSDLGSERGRGGATSGLLSSSSVSSPSFPLPSRSQRGPASLSSSFVSPSISPTSSSAASTAAATPSSSTTPRPRPASSGNSSPADIDDELPTRQPLSRFRPTRAPSDDEDASSGGAPTGGASIAASPLPVSSSSSASSLSSLSPPPSNITSLPFNNAINNTPNNINDYRITSECYECICEASTNCNTQSRCQTSDVRHTRCGMFLISYDQWLSSGLSKDLVTREALARDAAADERAFYDCVTRRECSERLLAIYLEKNSKDCDKDGRIDCYDLAAIHHSGLDRCASESLLDSQYWSDFNACFGFGRR